MEGDDNFRGREEGRIKGVGLVLRQKKIILLVGGAGTGVGEENYSG